MGTKTKDGPATLTTIYYSPIKDNILLLFKRDDSILITADLEKTRLVFLKQELQDYLIKLEYQLIGAFYEN
jgi:hypothetical protein